MYSEYECALLKQSAQYQAQAARLLADTNLPSILESYGRVKMVGSYAANLMVSGDIDIEVIGGPYDLNQIMEVQRILVNRKYFDSFLFIDIQSLKPRGLPYGYYIGPRKLINDEKWSLDIWFLTPDESARQHDVRRLLISEEDVNEEERMLILKAKQLSKSMEQPISSQKIYCWVLKEGVSTSRELEQQMLTHI